MQFTLDVLQSNPDLARLEGVLLELDPAAVLDLDASGRTVRMSTVLPRNELLDCLREAGLGADPEHLHQLPSQCCGGCSG